MAEDVESKVKVAKKAAIGLASVSTDVKDMALENMALALDRQRKVIIEANAADLLDAQELCEKGELSRALVDRLKVDDNKIKGMIASIIDVINLDDPVGRTLQALELDHGLNLYQVSWPIGLIGAIFESRPDVVQQIMSLCLKSGNATIFKGGSEAMRSNRAIFDVLVEAIEETEGIPHGAFQLMETREEVMDILKMDSYIDLLIPRGSNAFVKFIQDNTRIPVLGHADGICHVYVDNRADLTKAYDVCFDSKVQYPAVCNAVETLLVHKDIAGAFLPEMAKRYLDAGVELRCDEASYDIVKGIKALKAVFRATDEDWNTEYNDLILSVKVVDSIDEAIDHINSYGSHHTDAIVTGDTASRKLFVNLVDSSSVMVNASTRFADGFRYGKGAEVGISTNKIHARGPVGLEGLVIYKYVLMGNGDVVADYAGPDAKEFTHKELNMKYTDLIG
ncbi:MAG: glutamate-5-semialdehyde dehydrogenase [Methanosarcinaceae archaeon]|nr:glutamate-5-semialdehyde dehydrogenase [Methanosarcinaceae archaeon]